MTPSELYILIKPKLCFFFPLRIACSKGGDPCYVYGHESNDRANRLQYNKLLRPTIPACETKMILHLVKLSDVVSGNEEFFSKVYL